MNDGNITITISANAAQLSAALKNAVSNVKDMSRTISSENAAAREANDRLSESFESVRAASALALKAVGVAAAVGLGMAISSAGDFQSSLSQLRQASGATTAEMQELTQKARDLGKDTDLAGVTASKAASAMVELSKAGLSVKDTIDAAKGVMSLAKAGNIEYAEAATIAASALNAFSMKGSDATKVADALAAGANASQADLSDLALGLQQSATVAKQFKLSLNENVTALALFANSGIRGSDAGTSLKTMLIALANPSKEAAGAMKAIGFNAYDAKGNFVGLEEMSLRLNKGLAGVTDAQKQQTLATIFGTDAFRAAAILSDNAGKSYADMAASVGQAGAAQSAAAAQQGAYEKALENFSNAMSDIGITVGEKVLPPLTEFINMATQNLGPTFTFLSANAMPIAIGIGAIGTAFATIRVAGFISDLTKAQDMLALVTGPKNANGLRAIGTAFMTVSKAAATTVVALVKVTASFIAQNTALAITYIQYGLVRAGMLLQAAITQTVTAVQWLLNAAMSANPLTLIVIAITAVIAGLVLLWQNSETFRNIVTGAFNFVWSVIQGVWNWIAQNWPLLLAILSGPIGWAVYLIVQNWDTIKAAFASAWEFIKGVWSGVAAWFGGVWNGIVNAFSAVGSWFANIFSVAWNGIRNVFAGVGGFFQGIWNTIVSIFGSIGAAIGNGISGAVKGVVNSILSGAENIINGFIGAINGAINVINKIPGVSIGQLGYLHLPRLATGGIVPATTGGQQVIVAEGGQNEWVVPESKMASVVRQLSAKAGEGSAKQNVTYNQTFNIDIKVENDGTEFSYAQAVAMVKQIMRVLKSQGLKVEEMEVVR